ncbi:MAG: peptide deformylase [Alphaproteobacteria bacterium]
MVSSIPIVIAPDRRLKTRCKPIDKVDDSVRRRLDEMLVTMYEAPGIGLAGPQIGDERRLVVIDVAREGDQPDPMKLVNPEVTWFSDEMCVMSEGCLSIPDVYYDVKRPERVKFTYLDETGTEREQEADGLLARCVQHEIDHLNGILFIDHVSMLKRNMALTKMKKLKAQRAGKRTLRD